MGEALGIFVPFGLSAIVITVLIINYKLKKQELKMRGSDPQLREDLNDTRAQLAEMQGRLDFTERLLAGRTSQEDRSG